MIDLLKGFSPDAHTLMLLARFLAKAKASGSPNAYICQVLEQALEGPPPPPPPPVRADARVVNNPPLPKNRGGR